MLQNTHLTPTPPQATNLAAPVIGLETASDNSNLLKQINVGAHGTSTANGLLPPTRTPMIMPQTAPTGSRRQLNWQTTSGQATKGSESLFARFGALQQQRATLKTGAGTGAETGLCSSASASAQKQSAVAPAPKASRLKPRSIGRCINLPSICENKAYLSTALPKFRPVAIPSNFDDSYENYSADFFEPEDNGANPSHPQAKPSTDRENTAYHLNFAGQQQANTPITDKKQASVRKAQHLRFQKNTLTGDAVRAERAENLKKIQEARAEELKAKKAKIQSMRLGKSRP